MNTEHFKQIYFENLTLTGFSNPTVFTKTDGEIVLKNSTPIQVKVTDEWIDKFD